MSWVPVSARLPPDLSAVIVCCMQTDDGLGPWIGAAFRHDDRWISQDRSGKEDPLDADIAFPVTHWMPLPDPPTNTNEKEQS